MKAWEKLSPKKSEVEKKEIVGIEFTPSGRFIHENHVALERIVALVEK